MKKVVLTVFVFVVSVSFAKPQNALSKDQKAVQSTIVKMFEALSNRDSITVAALCSKDVLLFEYGQTWTIDTLIRKAIRLNKSADFRRLNTIQFITTTIDNDVAWTTYNNQADITKNGDHIILKWIETVILVRQKNEWKIKVLHATLLSKG